MPELHHPLPSATAATLRQAVLRLRTDEHRRRHGPVLHVGRPEGRYASYPDVGGLDQAIRTDVIAALLDELSPAGDERAGDVDPLVWLSRTGELSLQDVDAAWLAAARQACAEGGRCLTMVVVTRQGWWDPRSGARRVWKRLRVR